MKPCRSPCQHICRTSSTCWPAKPKSFRVMMPGCCCRMTSACRQALQLSALRLCKSRFEMTRLQLRVQLPYAQLRHRQLLERNFPVLLVCGRVHLHTHKALPQHTSDSHSTSTGLGTPRRMHRDLAACAHLLLSSMSAYWSSGATSQPRALVWSAGRQRRAGCCRDAWHCPCTRLSGRLALFLRAASAWQRPSITCLLRDQCLRQAAISILMVRSSALWQLSLPATPGVAGKREISRASLHLTSPVSPGAVRLVGTEQHCRNTWPGNAS